MIAPAALLVGVFAVGCATNFGPAMMLGMVGLVGLLMLRGARDEDRWAG